MTCGEREGLLWGTNWSPSGEEQPSISLGSYRVGQGAAAAGGGGGVPVGRHRGLAC